jgi:hypothetical protein
MGRWKTWVGLFFVFALATVGVSTAIHGGMGGFGRFLNRPIAVAPTASTAPTAAAPTATPFASEQDWIAAQIVRAIAEAGAFANHRDLTAGPRVKVAMGEHIWPPTCMSTPRVPTSACA